MKLYDFAASHNCYKVRLLLGLLDLPHEKQPVDLKAGEQKRPEFLLINPRGQVPVLEDDGFCVWDSNAILVYLARKYGGERWLPGEAGAMALVTQWLAVAQNEIFYGLGRAYWLKKGGTGDVEEIMRRSKRGLQLLESRLSQANWLAADHPTIADIACYPHAALAPEAGIPLDEYPSVVRWIKAVEGLPKYVGLGA